MSSSGAYGTFCLRACGAGNPACSRLSGGPFGSGATLRTQPGPAESRLQPGLAAPLVPQFSGALPVVSWFDGLDGAGPSDFSAGTGGRPPAADRAAQSVDQRVCHGAGGCG